MPYSKGEHSPLKKYALIALALLISLSGCGGGSSSNDPTNPVNPDAEWAFNDGDSATLGVWSSNIQGSEIGGISVVLRGDGRVDVISLGGTTGMTGIIGITTGRVNPDGTFETSEGTVRASGTLSHLGASVVVKRADDLGISTGLSKATTQPDKYSAYRGVWQGTYRIGDDVEEYPISFAVNEAGFVTGTITEGAAEGTLYGRVDDEAKTMILTVPYLNGSQPGWKFTAEEELDGTPHVSGTIASHDISDPTTGTWSADRQ